MMAIVFGWKRTYGLVSRIYSDLSYDFLTLRHPLLQEEHSWISLEINEEVSLVWVGEMDLGHLDSVHQFADVPLDCDSTSVTRRVKNSRALKFRYLIWK